MRFLIDTGLWIAIERGMLAVADIHALTRQQPVYLSPVNVAEFRFGIELMKDEAKRLKAMQTLRRMRRKPLLRITGDTAEVFASLAAKLEKTGRGAEFRIQDLWLAAQAVQRDFTVLTSNAKDRDRGRTRNGAHDVNDDSIFLIDLPRSKLVFFAAIRESIT